MTAIEQMKAEIARLHYLAGYTPSPDRTLRYEFAEERLRWALDLLTATPPAVAALPGKWREQAGRIVRDYPATTVGEPARTLVAALANLADELDAALKGDG